MKNLVYLSAILFLAACGGGDKPKSKAEELALLKKQRTELDAKITKLESETGKTNTKVTEVSVVSATAGLFENYLEVQGKVDAEQNVQVSAETPGTVVGLYAKVGQRVGKGQTLAQLDDKVLRQSIAQLQTQLDLATNLYNRQKNLWDQKIGTEVQFINAKSQKEGVEKQMSVLRSQASMYKIKSPISGTVDQMDLQMGQSVSPGMPSGIRVVNSSNLKVKAQVAESYAGRVNQGDEVNVILPDVPDSLKTRISFAAKVIDQSSRSFNIEVKLPSNNKYRPNMIAILKVVDYKNTNAIIIPVNAIQKSETGDYVMLAENGKAKRAVVKVGRTSEGKTEITSGLKEGDKVIVTGADTLNEGDPVKFN